MLGDRISGSGGCAVKNDVQVYWIPLWQFGSSSGWPGRVRKTVRIRRAPRNTGYFWGRNGKFDLSSSTLLAVTSADAATMSEVRLPGFSEDRLIELFLLVFLFLVAYFLYQYNKFHVSCHGGTLAQSTKAHLHPRMTSLMWVFHQDH